MDTKSPWVVIGGSVLLVAVLIMGTVSPSYGATVQLLLDQSIEIFRIGDFDPSDTALHPRVFTVIMNDPGTVLVRLRMTVTSDTYGPLAMGTTEPFELSGSEIISNQSLTDTGSEYEFEDYDVQPEGDELENLVLDLGYLPEGSYCFLIELLDADTEDPLHTAEDCLRVTNPINLELIRPGAPFGDALPRVLTRNPQFQFNSRARAWRFEIAKAEPGDGSGEDVMENIPVYETTICTDLSSGTCPPGSQPAFGGGALGTVSWSYPSAAEELRRGRTYCWRITALVQASGGEEELSSEIFCFKRWDPSDIGAEQVAEALAAALPELIDELGAELEGMIPTGTVLVDGTAVDPAEVKKILDDIDSGKLVIIERRLE